MGKAFRLTWSLYLQLEKIPFVIDRLLSPGLKVYLSCRNGEKDGHLTFGLQYQSFRMALSEPRPGTILNYQGGADYTVADCILYAYGFN